MQTVHYRRSITMTRTGGSSVSAPLNLDDAGRDQWVRDYLANTERTGWPVVLQEWETYSQCFKTATSDHCGHCNFGMPTTQISNAAWHDGNGSGRGRAVRQELFNRP